MFTLDPLTIVLPSKEDKDHPAIDLDLNLPFCCFRPQQLLQVLDTPVVSVFVKQEKTHTLSQLLSSLYPSVGVVLSTAGTADCAVFC